MPVALPALKRAEKLTRRAARVGFDWDGPEQVYEKLSEEIAEVQEAAETGKIHRIQDELGDVLFVAANLARKYGVDPETALEGTNRKFTKRFEYIETKIAHQGLRVSDVSLAEFDVMWEEAKAFDSIPPK